MHLFLPHLRISRKILEFYILTPSSLACPGHTSQFVSESLPSCCQWFSIANVLEKVLHWGQREQETLQALTLDLWMEKKDEPLPDSLAPLVEAPAGRGRLYPSASSLHYTLTQQSTATGNQALAEELPHPFDYGFEFQVKVPALTASVWGCWLWRPRVGSCM